MILENVINLLQETKEMVADNKQVTLKLQEALDIVQAIKDGSIDAVFMMNNKNAKVLVPKDADQTYRKFIENMQQGVVTLLDDGTILYSNRSFSEMVDLPLEKVLGTNLRLYIPFIYIETFERIFDGFPAENAIINISLPWRNADRHYMVTINKLPLENFMALNLVWTDITEITRAKEHLLSINDKLNKAMKETIFIKNVAERTNKETSLNIEQLKDSNTELASLAHLTSRVFEEPLRKIATYSSLLIRDYFPDINHEAQQYLAIIDRASIRMRYLVKDILEYSEFLNSKVYFSPTLLQSIIKQVCLNLAPEVQRTNASIVIRRDLPFIDADAALMIKLFQNILSNSLRFINNKVSPVIHIDYDIISDHLIAGNDSRNPVSEYCRILISDNGRGFNPVFNEDIFTMFEKLENKVTSPGTGIGLAICKKIVTMHHGTIKAHGMENGALFTIILPVYQLSTQ